MGITRKCNQFNKSRVKVENCFVGRPKWKSVNTLRGQSVVYLKNVAFKKEVDVNGSDVISVVLQD